MSKQMSKPMSKPISKYAAPCSFRLGIACAMVAVLFSLACNTAAPPRPVSEDSSSGVAAVQKPAPDANQKAISESLDVPISKLDGATFKLSDFKGKVLVVDFWATYCPPCVRQAPQLAELSRRYRDQGLEVVGLTSDEKSDEQKVNDFIKRVGMNYTVGYSNEWVSRSFLKGTESDDGTHPIPQQFVISRDGRVVEHLIGDSPQQGIPYLEKVVARELAMNSASR